MRPSRSGNSVRRRSRFPATPSAGLDVETTPVKDWPYKVYLEDVTGDGNLDVCTCHLGEGFVVYRGHGNGNASGPFQFKTNETTWCYDAAFADFDKDGKKDVVLAGNDAVYLRLGQ